VKLTPVREKISAKAAFFWLEFAPLAFFTEIRVKSLDR
jgi:hypothetical protein